MEEASPFLLRWPPKQVYFRVDGRVAFIDLVMLLLLHIKGLPFSLAKQAKRANIDPAPSSLFSLSVSTLPFFAISPF